DVNPLMSKRLLYKALTGILQYDKCGVFALIHSTFVSGILRANSTDSIDVESLNTRSNHSSGLFVPLRSIKKRASSITSVFAMRCPAVSSLDPNQSDGFGDHPVELDVPVYRRLSHTA